MIIIAVQDGGSALIVCANNLPEAGPTLIVHALDDKIFEELGFRGIFHLW